MSRAGFNNWPFMSVHTWGEAPHGNWQLEIFNEGKYMGKLIIIIFFVLHRFCSSDKLNEYRIIFNVITY